MEEAQTGTVEEIRNAKANLLSAEQDLCISVECQSELPFIAPVIAEVGLVQVREIHEQSGFGVWGFLVGHVCCKF